MTLPGQKGQEKPFSFWPTLFQYEVDETSPHGDFFMSVTAVSTISVELWLSMDDLTRHKHVFSTTGGGKTETTFARVAQPSLLGKRLYLC